jgi:hypothetical protein
MSNIAIVRDGYSDYLVLKQFLKVLLKNDKGIDLDDENFYEFQSLNLRDIIENYKLDKDDTRFINSIATVLYTAYNKLSKEKDEVSNKDILLLNSDSEKQLGKREKYFEEWAYNINHNLWKAIDLFYEKMVVQGYSYEYLPLIFPLILFPSSEILVASCMYDFQKENCHALKAKPELKMKVYGSDKIPEVLTNGHLENVLSTYLVSDSLSSIYKELPEIRRFIHMLSV